MNMISEKKIEQYLCMKAKKAGGIAIKLISPSFAGMPDRMILLPQGKIIFVELKTEGRKARKLQLSRHIMLRNLGFFVIVIDQIEQVDKLFDYIMKERKGENGI